MMDERQNENYILAKRDGERTIGEGKNDMPLLLFKLEKRE